MNRRLTSKFNLIALFMCLVWFFIAFKSASAETEKDINATIKLSVCGNGAAEFPEDCDGVDLDQKNCRDLGYQSGDLDCDLSCEYDVSRCTGVLETPSPTPTSQPTTSPTVAPTATAGSSSSSSTSSSNQSVTTTVTKVIEQLKERIDTRLQVIQEFFDFDGSGKIEVEEVREVVKTWVEEWRAYLQVQTAFAKGEISEAELVKPEKCDINKDGVCDAVDLSVLFFYVER